MLSTTSAQPQRLIPRERDKLLDHFRDKLEIASHLNRQAVSFQTNKTAPIYRWVKYKEGFSADLVKYFLNEYAEKPGNLLDPFAGSGTALFAGQELGWNTFGIELLPVGTFIMKARGAISKINPQKLANAVKSFRKTFSTFTADSEQFAHISITKGAFPDETEKELNRFLN